MKVAYSITRYCKSGNYQMKGIGKINGNDLILKNGKVFEDVVKQCHKIFNRPNEYSGFYEEYQEIDVKDRFGSYETIEILAEFKVWYKII